MNRVLWLAANLLLLAAPASANPGMSGLPNMMILLATTCLTLFLIWWSGADEIMKAAGIKRWSILKRLLAIIFLFIFGVVGFWVFFLIGLTGYAIQQGVRMLRWGRASSQMVETKPPFLASARPKRLIAAGWLTITAALESVALCAILAFELDMMTSLRKSHEGATKGNLGSIRSVLSIYYGDHKNRYPEKIAALTVYKKYLNEIPVAKISHYHPDSAAVHYGKISDDAGGWLYDNIPGDAHFGEVWVNCTHTDGAHCRGLYCIGPTKTQIRNPALNLFGKHYPFYRFAF